ITMTARSFTTSLLVAFAAAAMPLSGIALAQAAPQPVQAAAQAGTPATTEQERQAAITAIQAKLNSISTMHGTFVQTGPNGEMTEGRVYIQRPGKMRFEYDDPHPMLIVADGRRVAVEDRK